MPSSAAPPPTPAGGTPPAADSPAYLVPLAGFLRDFWLVVKRTGLYGAHHPSILPQLVRLSGTINELLASWGVLAIRTGGTKLYVDQRPLPDRGDNLRQMAIHLHRRGVAVLQFTDQATHHDLARFIALLNRTPQAIHADGGLSTLLANTDITAIVVREKEFDPLAQRDENPATGGVAFDPEAFWIRIFESAIHGHGTPDDTDYSPEVVQAAATHLRLHGTSLAATLGKMVARLESTIEQMQGLTWALGWVGFWLERHQVGDGPAITQQVLNLYRGLTQPLRHAFILTEGLDDATAQLHQAFLQALTEGDAVTVLLEVHARGAVDYPYLHRLLDLLAAEPSRRRRVLKTLLARLNQADTTGRHAEALATEFRSILQDRSAMPVATAPSDRQLALLRALKTDEAAAERMAVDFRRAVDHIESGMVEYEVARILGILLEDEQDPEEFAILARQVQELFRYFVLVGQYDHAREVLDLLYAHYRSGSELDNRKAGIIAELLGNLQDEELVTKLIEALQKWGKDRADDICTILGQMGATPIGPLTRALAEESDRSVRKILLGLVTGYGFAALPETAKLLRDSRWYVVRNALNIIRDIGSRRAMDLVIPVLSHPDSRVRKEAIVTAVHLGGIGAIPHVRPLLHNQDQSVMMAAVSALARLRDSAVVHLLVEHLQQINPYDRENAGALYIIQMLGEMGMESAVPCLASLLQRSSLLNKARYEEVQSIAARALGKIPSSPALAALRAGERSRSREVREICGQQARALLQRLSRNG